MRDCTTILKSCYNDEGISYPVATTSVVDNPVPRGRLQW